MVMVGSLKYIFGIYCTSNPASFIINGAIRLCLIDWTYNEFLAIKRYVFIEYGQSYTMSVSTIGTLLILPTSLAKALTYSCLPEKDIM